MRKEQLLLGKIYSPTSDVVSCEKFELKFIEFVDLIFETKRLKI